MTSSWPYRMENFKMAYHHDYTNRDLSSTCQCKPQESSSVFCFMETGGKLKTDEPLKR